MSDVANNKRRYAWDWVFCGVISALMLLTFWPVTWFEFILFDDPAYVTDNPIVQAGLTADGIKWAFTGIHGASWHPLATLSHMVDCQLWGLNPRGHHLTNLGLHWINTLLLFGLMRCWLKVFWPSALICCLWALHPLRVESVAWITERKGLLCMFWALTSLWAYSAYAANHAQRPAVARRYYFLSLGLFTLGLLSKGILVTWPAVLLVLDFWPLNRFRANSLRELLTKLFKLIPEKMPFFALALITSYLTYWAQNTAGAVTSVFAIPWLDRAANAIVAYLLYLYKTVWPMDLAVFYPHPKSWPQLLVLLGVLLLGTFSLASLLAWRQRPFIIAGWAWFIGTMVPTIGLVQVGAQAMADRFTYLPSLGLLWFGVYALWGAVENWRLREPLFAGLVCLAMIAGNVLTTRVLGQWHNTITLFDQALTVTDNNVIAHEALGARYLQMGLHNLAKQHFERALAIDPNTDGIKDLALIATKAGKADEAQVLYDRSLATLKRHLSANPTSTRLLLAYATTLEAAGRSTGEIVPVYRDLLRNNPQFVEALNNLAWMLATATDISLRNGSEAVSLAQRACELTSYENTIFMGTYAAALAETGRFQEALAMADRAIVSARKKGEKSLEETNLKLKELYLAGKAVGRE